jgi:hypothetical protein
MIEKTIVILNSSDSTNGSFPARLAGSKLELELVLEMLEGEEHASRLAKFSSSLIDWKS